MESSNSITAPSRNRDRVLVIMAKAPRPGMVKTRLAQSLPVPAVSALYRCLLNDTVALAQSLQSAEVVMVCPASDVQDLAGLAGDGLPIVAQKGEGLASALSFVFAHFAADYKRIIAFNSDSPHLPASVLENGFGGLAVSDVVVGPTHDGGYYLVGATAAYPGLFDGDAMGTTSALEALLRRARALGLSVHFTDPFYDIDVASDLTRLAAELQIAPARAPRTAAWLAEWSLAVTQLQPGQGDL
jgi:rSAM/selenodomain-associated transferase 1